MMVQCNAMSMLVNNGAAAVSSSSRALLLMVSCNSMVWVDETEGQTKVLVTSSDPVTGTAVTTEEQVMQRMALSGMPAKRRYMESKWWEGLWQAMQRLQKSKAARVAALLGRWSVQPSASARRMSVRRRRCSPRPATGERTCSTRRASNRCCARRHS